MIIKTAQELIDEFRGIVSERVPLILAHTKGAQLGLDLQVKVDGLPPDISWVWILRAHVGTLEKLQAFLPDGRVPSSAELLMAARNLFENLLWLRLFGLDPEYGVTFYAPFQRRTATSGQIWQTGHRQVTH